MALENIERTQKTDHFEGLIIPVNLIDHYGHVNYKNVSHLLEFGQDSFMAKREIPFNVLDEAYNLRSVVKALEVEYANQIFAGDKIDIFTNIDHVGNTSFSFAQEIERAGEILSRGRLVVVMINPENIPTPIPAQVRKRLME